MRLARLSPSNRLVGIDVARCLALLAMMSTHMLRPVQGSEVTWSQTLAGGRAAALFAVLAGVSLALMTGRGQPHRGQRRLSDAAGITARALVIGAVGLVLGALETNVAVILVYYSLLFVLGLPFLGLGPRALAWLALAWGLVAPVVSHALRPHVGAWPPSVPTVGDLEVLSGLVRDLLLTGYYPAFPWLTYLLAGLAIGRLDLTRPAVAARVAFCGAVLAGSTFAASRLLTSSAAVRDALLTSPPEPVDDWAGLERVLRVGLHGTTPTDTWWWLAVVAPHSSTSFDLLHTTGTAMVVIGLALLVARLAPPAWAVVFGAGAMPLTLYSAHVVMLTPEVWPGMGVDGYLRQVAVVLGIGAVFALARWRGPLEAVARLAYLLAATAMLPPPRGTRRLRR